MPAGQLGTAGPSETRTSAQDAGATGASDDSAGARRTCVTLLLTAAAIAAPMAVQAQAKGQSDRAVTILMEFAWNTIPRQFRQPNGEVIIIDRANKNEIMVPLEKAREIVNVGDRSARAQYCDLPEEQTANFQSMMRRELASEQWTKQQLVFITLLHATTVAYLTGTMKVHVRGRGRGGTPRSSPRDRCGPSPAPTRCARTSSRGSLAYINEVPAIPAAKDAIRRASAPSRFPAR